MKKHLKRLNAPKHWMLDKLGGAFVSDDICVGIGVAYFTHVFLILDLIVFCMLRLPSLHLGHTNQGSVCP